MKIEGRKKERKRRGDGLGILLNLGWRGRDLLWFHRRVLPSRMEGSTFFRFFGGLGGRKMFALLSQSWVWQRSHRRT